ncbi:MAG: TIGR00300 family protein [Planctomycetia bacterium]|mgnify:FL=1|nr:TIGR00300 family protein [Planctomycetia bacterium]MBL6915148.1 TIGR00300 family protein [Planctomycetota bacterium]HCW45090.1 TIGR00300 family protein [Planctomycetota bacterium]
MTEKFENILRSIADEDSRALLERVRDLFSESLLTEGESFEVLRLTETELHLGVRADQKTIEELLALGFEQDHVQDPEWQSAPADGVAPESFYSTTHHKTQVWLDGEWTDVLDQRMDGCLTLKNSNPVCIKLRDIKEGSPILTGFMGVRLVHDSSREESHEFAFMANDVSSERRAEVQTKRVVDLARKARDKGQKIVWVPGPVIVHTGASRELELLVRAGWVDSVLSGNALAVHDIEAQWLGTSLGVSVEDGRVMPHGHSHHMRAINKVRAHGSIPAAVQAGDLESGLMHSLVENNIPYVLAGSIRDDGPLPDTEMDLFKAQDQYAEQLKGAGLVIILSTMLHGIGVGNMLSGEVPLVCVDIHPAVATKLADRGSAQAIGIVTDVGLFVRRLREQLIEG